MDILFDTKSKPTLTVCGRERESSKTRQTLWTNQHHTMHIHNAYLLSLCVVRKACMLYSHHPFSLFRRHLIHHTHGDVFTRGSHRQIISEYRTIFYAHIRNDVRLFCSTIRRFDGSNQTQSNGKGNGDVPSTDRLDQGAWSWKM